MGLTIHYTLAVRHQLQDADAGELVAQARSFARAAEADSVSRLFKTGVSFPFPHEWVAIPYVGGAIHVDVAPEAGYAFSVVVGPDCEHLLLGLCRYPAIVEYQGRSLSTKVGAGWRWRHYCKTQYASLHGWEHFLRCHRTVIALLAFWRTLGVNVRISDEGGYWPRGSETNLRRRLEEMNGIVAAASGALKDQAEGVPVESPIFGHPRYERLEAEGAARHAAKMKLAVAALGKLAGSRRGK